MRVYETGVDSPLNNRPLSRGPTPGFVRQSRIASVCGLRLGFAFVGHLLG